MKKKQRISDLFYDNRFLLVFSIIAAIVFWLVVVVVFGTEVENTVKSVPVQVDYSKLEEDFGLQPFGETKFTVDVTVKGQKYIVESEDIIDELVVTADTGFVNSVGTYTLSVDATTKDARPAFNIVDISSDEIQIYFDYFDEEEFVIEPEIELENKVVVEGYHIGDYIFPETNTVRVSGPESEVNRITSVVARATVKDELRQNETVEASLVALAKDGSVVQNITFNKQSGKVKITLPVYKIATLPVTCSFINKPSDYVENLPFSVTISPSSALLGVPEKKLEGITGFEITSIDFSKIKEGINTFVIKASEITGAVVLDETEEFTVTVTVADMTSETIAAPSNVSFVNVPGEMTAVLSTLNFNEITVVGPENSVKQINAENISITADLNNIDPSVKGNITVPVTLADNDCWSYGEYTATITIS